MRRNYPAIWERSVSGGGNGKCKGFLPLSYLTQWQESSKIVSTNLSSRLWLAELPYSKMSVATDQNGENPDSPRPHLPLSIPIASARQRIACPYLSWPLPNLCQKPRGGCWDWDFPFPCALTGAKSFKLKSPEPPSWVQVAGGPRGFTWIPASERASQNGNTLP